MTPAHGHVWLDGEHIQHYAVKRLHAGLVCWRKMLPHRANHRAGAGGAWALPASTAVYPWRKEDEDAVTKAMQATGITHWRIKAWTPFLADNASERGSHGAGPGNGNYAARRTHDLAGISHQIDLLELLSELNREKG